jgi:uncharacterized protein YuzE
VSTPKFRLETSFNEQGEPIAAYLRIREGRVAETKEISEGVVFADYSADGRLLGIELLAECSVEVLDRLAAQEPDAVQRFLREGVRRQLVVA